jgi:hypothetical protein
MGRLSFHGKAKASQTDAYFLTVKPKEPKNFFILMKNHKESMLIKTVLHAEKKECKIQICMKWYTLKIESY